MTLIDTRVHALVWFSARARRKHHFFLFLLVAINWPLVDFITWEDIVWLNTKQMLLKDYIEKTSSF